MINWKNTLIALTATIEEAVHRINSSGLQIALVVDEFRRLKGTVTDGDIRRGILNGVSLDSPVHSIMNKKPRTVTMSEDRDAVLQLMRMTRLHQIPILDRKGHVIGIEILDELMQPTERSNWVVLMAGGLGTRLHPLTHDVPKPLLHVGSKPILETILENLLLYGFRRFYFSVNYKADMIEEYFGDGSRWDAEIRYIREKEQMGTAGALGLLPETPEETFMVMNGDLLTRLNAAHLMAFHWEHRAAATMCVREYDMQVPYGVVQIDDHKLLEIDEKPTRQFFVNAGIYTLEPEVFSYITPNTRLQMSDLFQNLIRSKCETVVFPILEYWIDVGQMDDYDRANGEFLENFE